jgi:hypothetical protein
VAGLYEVSRLMVLTINLPLLVRKFASVKNTATHCSFQQIGYLPRLKICVSNDTVGQDEIFIVRRLRAEILPSLAARHEDRGLS